MHYIKNADQKMFVRSMGIYLSGRKGRISGLQAMAVSRLTLFEVAIEEVRVINTVKKATFLIILGQVRYLFLSVNL